jgi:hypothetical protein
MMGKSVNILEGAILNWFVNYFGGNGRAVITTRIMDTTLRVTFYKGSYMFYDSPHLDGFESLREMELFLINKFKVEDIRKSIQQEERVLNVLLNAEDYKPSGKKVEVNDDVPALKLSIVHTDTELPNEDITPDDVTGALKTHMRHYGLDPDGNQ